MVLIAMEAKQNEQNEPPGQKEPFLESLPETNNSSGKRRNTLIFACSGLSNTGKLTMQAASTLAFRRPDLYRAAAALKGTDAVEDALSEGFRVLVLDGCTDRCATKKLDEAGIQAEVYLVVTEIGIEKTRPSDVKPEYIEKIIRAVKEA
ncbi:MAG: putative zinc-binding protein [Methanosarcina mazei]